MSSKKETPLQWILTEHCCRICLGRVLVRTTFDHQKIYKCSNCETEVQSEHVTGLCCCGMKMRNNRDMGIRCQVNEGRTPENPSYIVAAQVDLAAFASKPNTTGN